MPTLDNGDIVLTCIHDVSLGQPCEACPSRLRDVQRGDQVLQIPCTAPVIETPEPPNES